MWYFLLLFFHITKSYRFELEEHVFLIILLTMILIFETLQNVYLTTTLEFWKRMMRYQYQQYKHKGYTIVERENEQDT